MMRRLWIAILFVSVCIISGNAQEETSIKVVPGGFLVPVAEYKGEYIPSITMPQVNVYSTWRFMNEKEKKKFDKLVRDVKKVLPIAKEINTIIIETYEYLETLPNEKARQTHIKEVEKGLKKQYTPRLKKLTFSQGKLLIKLVNRQTHSSGYELVKAFMGSFKAFFLSSLCFVVRCQSEKRISSRKRRQNDRTHRNTCGSRTIIKKLSTP